MEIKTLAKNTMILASPKVLKFLVGIIRSKLIAVFLGTEGMGIINQLQTTIRQISTFTLSSLPQGMVKLIAKENSVGGNYEKITGIIKMYLVIVIPLTVFVTILGYYYASEITLYVFGDIKYKLYFQIGYIAVPMSILSSSSISLLQAYKEIKSIAKSGIVIILINFVLFIPLIYFYKITGGIIYVTLSFFTTFLVFHYFTKKNVLEKHDITIQNLKKAVLSKIYFKELISFMGFGLVAGTYYIFTEITARAIVVNELGIDKLGVYAPIRTWSSLFVGFILPSLNTYLFPRISEAKDDVDITGVVNDVIRLTTFVTLPFIIIGISIRQWIIPFFYSVDFIEANIYLPYHFAGLMFMIWTFAFTYIFAPTGRLKIFLVFAIIVHSTSLALVYFLVPEFGLFGYMAKFTITPIVSLIIYFIYWSKEIKFKLKPENIKIILYSLFSITFLLLLQNNNGYLQLLAVSLLVFELFLLKKEEKEYLIKKIRRKR